MNYQLIFRIASARHPAKQDCRWHWLLLSALDSYVPNHSNQVFIWADSFLDVDVSILSESHDENAAIRGFSLIADATFHSSVGKLL